MTTSSYHRGDLKERLVERAVQVISENGVEALSLRQLAKDLAVSHSAPSRHFSSKADLLSAVAAYGFSQMMLATGNAISEKEQDSRAILRAMALANINWAAKNPMLYLAMRNYDVTRHADEDLKVKLQEFAGRQLDMVKAAQKTGWNAHLNAKSLHIEIVSMLTGISVNLCDPLHKNALGLGNEQKYIEQSIDLVLAERG